MNTDYPIITFPDAQAWESWLNENQGISNGIWIKIFKKDTETATVTHEDALEVALCYGWIDGQRLKNDDQSFLQKFTPRRARSLWSKRNIEKVERLEKEGRMKEGGRKEVESAKSEGRWSNAYDSPANMKLPQDFKEALMKNDKAAAFYNTLKKVNTYAIGWRINTAKRPETRAKRILSIIEMLEKGEKFY